MATVYVGDLVEIDFADGQPDGSMLYEAVKPGPEVVVLDGANGSKSVVELSIVAVPPGSAGSPVGLLVRIAGLLMLAVGAFGLVIGWWGALPSRPIPR
jgi:hypothetical protein